MVTIHPGAVRALGRAASGVAGTVRGAKGDIDSAETETNSANLTGLASKASFDSVFRQWVPAANSLGATVDIVAGKLTSTANIYQGSDDEGVDLFRFMHGAPSYPTAYGRR